MDPVAAAQHWSQLATTVRVGAERVAVIDVALGDADARDAPPLLVIHGFPTSSIDFEPLVERLGERRIVLVDLPGYGLSDKPDRGYSLFGQADAVEAVVGALHLGVVDLLTHDMGDSVGGELLARSLEGRAAMEVRRRVLTNGSIYLELRPPDRGSALPALPSRRGSPGRLRARPDHARGHAERAVRARSRSFGARPPAGQRRGSRRALTGHGCYPA